MKYVIALLMISLVGCSNISKNFDNSGDVIFNAKRFEVGDILIKQKGKKFLNWWGHSSIVISENMIGDFPKIKEGYQEINIEDWIEPERKVLVLRCKYSKNKNFKEILLRNIEKYKNIKYKIFFKKENKEGVYCSKFIWLVYKETFKELGIEGEIDSDGGWVVFPYDFIKSEIFFKVNLYKIVK